MVQASIPLVACDLAIFCELYNKRSLGGGGEERSLNEVAKPIPKGDTSTNKHKLGPLARTYIVRALSPTNLAFVVIVGY